MDGDAPAFSRAEKIHASFSDMLMIEIHNKNSAKLIMLTLVLTKMAWCF